MARDTSDKAIDACCVPLVTRNGPLGALYVGSARPDAFSENDVTLLGHTSAQIAIALENARAYEEVTDRNAHLIDEKQYLERELDQQFADIVGKTRTVPLDFDVVQTARAIGVSLGD
jgi:formate hydrogenlyase transcriptional activator